MRRDEATGRLIRDPLPRTGPDRRAGNYYRSAADDGQGKGGTAIGGIPLDSAESAVVAAVRMAYRVAEVQIDRSARLAQRLREAGDRAAGPGSDRKALDAAELLVRKAFMALLAWVEAAGVKKGSPLRRLVAAQYRLLGEVLGLGARPASEADDERTPARKSEAVGNADEGSPRAAVRVKHTGPERRVVRVSAWEYTGGPGAEARIPVTFYKVAGPAESPLDAVIVMGTGRAATLELATPSSIAAGRWRAALCEADGMQVGYIEIVL
jgi:hypothetical protein